MDDQFETETLFFKINVEARTLRAYRVATTVQWFNCNFDDIPGIKWALHGKKPAVLSNHVGFAG